MSSPILSRAFSPEEQAFLAKFAEGLNIPIEKPGDAAKVQGILEKILQEGLPEEESPSLEGSLTGRVSELQEMLLHPSVNRANVFTIRALQTAMKGLVEEKISELKGFIARENHLEVCQKIWEGILTKIPAHRIASFINTVEGFTAKALSEGGSPREALPLALAKGLVRCMVDLPSSKEMAENEELMARIEADPDLKAYTCAITREVVGADAVYLREDKDHNPRERYSKKAIEDWIRRVGTDPVTRDRRALSDIKPDFKAMEFIENKILPWIYPELESNFSSFQKGEALQSKSLLLSVAAAYPIVKREYERVLDESQNPHFAIRAAEGLSSETMDRFTSLVEGVNFEGEEIVPACFPCIEEFIRQAGGNLKEGEDLETVKFELIKKQEAFVTFYHEIDSVQMPASLKEQALKMAEEAIGKGSTLEEVRELVAEYMVFVKAEDEIAIAFPGCLLGAKVWARHLGAVEKLPIPEGMLEILSQPCPITLGKRVGETHMLVLIPERVGGQPLTLTSLGSLVKAKGHFLDSEAGYCYMDPDVTTEQGNVQSGPAHYVLMLKDILPGSIDKRYEDQQAMVAALATKAGVLYEAPPLLQAVACVYMNYLDSGTRLFGDKPWSYARCQEQVEGRYPIIIGGFSSLGLSVRSCDYDGDDNEGVAVLRRF